MKTLPLALAAVLFAALAVPAPAKSASNRAPPLRGGECLDPDYARGWVYLDERNVLVDTGRYRYLIELNTMCNDLNWSPFIAFRGDPVSGRVCGTAFDQILTRERPCTIRRMSLISKEEYKALEQQHSRKGRKGRRAIPRSYD